jgi:hypothetical protein
MFLKLSLEAINLSQFPSSQSISIPPQIFHSQSIRKRLFFHKPQQIFFSVFAISDDDFADFLSGKTIKSLNKEK